MKANDRQVGGNHYAAPSGFQHWDFVAANGLNYFEGQITKYVARCRKKNGMEDLKKAMHFLEKYMEVFAQISPALTPLAEQKRQLDPCAAQGSIETSEKEAKNFAAGSKQFLERTHSGLGQLAGQGVVIGGTAQGNEQWQAAAGQQNMEAAAPQYQSDAFFLAEGGYGNGVTLYTCRICGTKVHGRSLLEVAVRHGAPCTGRGAQHQPV